MKRPTVDSNGAFLENEMGCDVEEEQELSSQVGLGASGSMGFCEKKRRLSVEQVKALEKNFEVENKLEPERKVKLAMELGLQPRQVAVWFQNRRARWKTKQLERDYTSLKSNYDSLKLSYDALLSDKDSLLAEIRELKLKLGGTNDEPFAVEEIVGEEHRNEAGKDGEVVREEEVPELISKDGSSDSDSSAIFNENSPNHLVVSEDYRVLQKEEDDDFLIGFQHQYNEEKGSSRFPFCYYSHRGEVEEHGLLEEVEPSNTVFFSDDSPAVPWYCSEQWS